jgi:hypothetical protein
MRKKDGLGMLKLLRVGVVLAVAYATIVIAAPEPALADTEVVANWQMNEGSSASTMIDSGPFGLHGDIGDDVITDYSILGATGYRWLYKRPNEFPAEPERLITVPHDWHLNPGSGDFAIEFRYRTDKNFGNVLQKGQSHSAGGYFKFEQPNGFMTCLFKDGSGKRRATTSPIATNDNQWHTIRCELDGSRLKLYVDGNLVRNVSQSLGEIANTKDFSIGGKQDCDQVSVTCDYFTGQIDYVTIEREGVGSPPPPPPPPPPPGGGDISYVDSNTDTSSSSSHDVNIPSVEPGDLLILFATSAGTASVGDPSGGGWNALGTASEDKLMTRVWIRVAQSGDSGDEIMVPFSGGAKGNVTVVAYRGASDIGDWDLDVPSGSSDTRITPVSEAGASEAFAVSFWVHRDSTTDAFNLLDSAVVRESDAGTGGGHPTILLADSGGAVTGSYGNLGAMADSSSSRGNTWTIILDPD